MADTQQEQPQGDQPDKEEPRIIRDDDWKAEAQAEKERLDAELKAQKQAAQETPAGEAPGQPAEGEQRRLPPASFPVLVSSLATQALLALGGMEDRKTKKRLVDFELAKHHIDTLAVLEEKTKGNLSDDEAKLLENALYQTRMQYVELAQHIQQAGVDQAGAPDQVGEQQNAPPPPAGEEPQPEA